MRQSLSRRSPSRPRSAGAPTSAAAGFAASPPARRGSADRRFEIGAASDPLEREADRVADAVVRSPAGAPSTPGGGIGRDPGAPVRRTLESPFSIDEARSVTPEEDEEGPVQAQPAAAGAIGDEEDEEPLQAKAAGEGAVAGASSSAAIGRALGQAGRPLPPPVRADFEGRFGHDFSQVRVHAGAAADVAARAIGARAFTRERHLVFAAGQYAPETRAGRWLLAHELTHVVQQGAAGAAAGDAGPAAVRPAIRRRDAAGAVRRVDWTSARDTGRDAAPWPSLPYTGDVMAVRTDAGTPIPAWRPHDGRTYWCHGYTFGGSTAAGGPYSLWGSDVPTVLRDDGWTHQVHSCVTQPADILVFWQGSQLMHSGIARTVREPGGVVDEAASTLESKWGAGSHNTSSWERNATTYGRYRVYSKQPALGPCAGKGANER
ncbi:MAG TPA: DUF4157 domain-containing protein [Thermoanaerobaculia bacterium]